MNFNPIVQKKMFELAKEAQKKAYAPYSNHSVGAAILTASGNIYSGTNVENSVYPCGFCAEQGAASACILAGDTEFVEILTVTTKGGPPCGQCRQVLSEFSDATTIVHICSPTEIIESVYLDNLLPGKFVKSHLPKK